MTNEVREVLVRLLGVLRVQGGQLECDADAVLVLHRRHYVQTLTLATHRAMIHSKNKKIKKSRSWGVLDILKIQFDSAPTRVEMNLQRREYLFPAVSLYLL